LRTIGLNAGGKPGEARDGSAAARGRSSITSSSTNAERPAPRSNSNSTTRAKQSLRPSIAAGDRLGAM